jgi:hypothetical protein
MAMDLILLEKASSRVDSRNMRSFYLASKTIIDI